MKTKTLIVISLLTILCSCGQNSGSSENLTFFDVQDDAFTHLVNSNSMPISPDLKSDITLINEEYPIEISLYSNKKFYYDLPTLGDGEGTWELKDGHIELLSKRTLFDMYIEIKALDPKADEVAITFTDRFGPQSIRMRKKNL